jgi:hypothetical protein
VDFELVDSFLKIVEPFLMVMMSIMQLVILLMELMILFMELVVLFMELVILFTKLVVRVGVLFEGNVIMDLVLRDHDRHLLFILCFETPFRFDISLISLPTYMHFSQDENGTSN